MPKVKISEYSATANSNTDVASINIDEGCAPSGINNAIRAVMGHLKDFQSGTSNDPFTVGSSGSLTLSYGTANGVAYLNGSKVLTTGSALTFDGSILTNTSGAIRASGASVPAAGAGLELLYGASGSGISTVLSYDRGAAAYKPLWIDGSYQAYFISGSEQMRLTSTGLGIGTSSPGQPLHVSKNQNASTWAYVSNTTAGTGSAAGFLFASDVVTGAIQAVSSLNTGVGNNNSLWIRTTGAYPITLGTNSTVQMTLDSSGNLGLGVTPSAWSASYKAFQFVAGSIASVTSGEATYLHNAFINTSGNYAYINAAAAARYSQSGGVHYWFNAPAWSGTGSPNISFTQAMTLDASGNLLVNTTSAVTTTVGSRLMYGATDPYISSTLTSSSNATTSYLLYSTGAAAYRFYVGMGGTVYATNTTISAISDQRLKENIRDLDDGLASVMALKPRKFDWKEGKGQDIKNARGFIAQEFEIVFPDMIDEWKDPAPEGEEPYKAINANLIPTLVKAIQELKAEFDAYKASHP